MATIPRSRQVHAELLIGRAGGSTWVNVTDCLQSAAISLGSVEDIGTGTGADIGVRTLEFTLKSDGANVYFWFTTDVFGDSLSVLGDATTVVGDSEDDVMSWLSTLLGEPKWGRNSFAPRDKSSEWNQFEGRWQPLLWPYRSIKFNVSITEPGQIPTRWITPFEGYLGDNITTDAHTVSVQCRDKSKLLQDAYIDVPKTYEGPMSAEALIQSIISDYVDGPPTLFTPVPSGITFDEMKVEHVSVWDAVQNVAKQMGWFLGYRWNGTSFVLTLLEPPRNKNVADFEFDWVDDIYRETLEIGDSEIRNALTLSYRDKSSGERVTLRHADHPQLRNQASIDEYTRRIMQIEEADTSLIDTQAEALAFGEKCIWDLSELSATDRLDLPLLPELDLFSTLTTTNPLVSSTKDFYSVQSIRHSLTFGENGRYRTEVIATGRVVGARSRWLDMETRPGRPGKPLEPDRLPDGSLPDSKKEDYGIIPDKVIVKSPHMDSDANVVLFWYQVDNVKVANYEVLVGNDSYLTNSTNFPLTGLYVDAQLTAKVRAISHYGKIGPWSETVVVDMPKLLNKTVEATYLAKQRFQTLLDNHFYGDEDGYFDGKTIKPNTVETQAIAVGSPLRAFMLRGITIEPNADGEKKWRNTAGYLVQIEGDNYQINALTETQASGIYYVYARVHKTISNTANNRFLFETEKRTTHEDATYYYFAVGVYDTTGDAAIWASSYGYTMIDGHQITTGAVTADKIGAEAVTADKIKGGAITADKLTISSRTFVLDDVQFEANHGTPDIWQIQFFSSAGYLRVMDGETYVLNWTIKSFCYMPVEEGGNEPIQYAYAQVNKNPAITAQNKITFSTTKRTELEVGDYHYFYIGVYDFRTPSVPKFVTNYGYTIIDGGHIETGEINAEKVIIRSADGRTTFKDNIIEVRDLEGVTRVRIGKLS